MGEKCQKAGPKLYYHHHAFEFQPTDRQVLYEILIQALGPALVCFAWDVFWASLAGRDPSQLLKKLNGKVSLLHLKDKRKGTPVIYDEGKVKPETFKKIRGWKCSHPHPGNFKNSGRDRAMLCGARSFTQSTTKHQD